MSLNNIVSEGVNHNAKLFQALALREAGFSIIPIDTDGTKRPAPGFRWRNYSARRPTVAEIESWFADVDQDIAVIGGEVSGNLAMLDFDEKNERGIFDKWLAAVDPEIFKKLALVRTPSGGFHRYCRTPSPVRTRKLACDEEGRTLIELKAEGGYCLAPGNQSYGTYELLDGKLEDLPTLTAAEWENLISAARALNRCKRIAKDRAGIEPDVDHEEAIAAIPVPLDERQQAAAAWLFRQPGAIQGRGADGYCFALAIKLLKGFALPEDDACELLYDWGQRPDQQDGAGNPYPWSMAEISHKVADAVSADYDGTVGDKLGLATILERQVANIVKAPIMAAPAPTASSAPSPAVQEATRQRVAANPVGFRRWSGLKATAATQTEDWLIPHWLEFGSLTMLTGLPFSGKSCLVAEIVASMATGNPWCDLPLPAVPILLLDLENKERIIVRRISAALEGDEGQLEDLLYAVDVKTLDLVNEPLDGPRIGEIIDALRQAVGGFEKCFVVIDTMRSAFGGKNEIDPQEMSGLLYPLQRMAKDHNAALLLLHHNSRGKDQYAGTAAIAAACDYLWNWHSDYKTCEGVLEMVGTRGDQQEALHFLFDKQKRRNVFIGRDGDVSQVKRSKEDLEKYGPILAACPTEPTPKLIVKKHLMAALTCCETTARTYITNAIDKGWLSTEGDLLALSSYGSGLARQWLLTANNVKKNPKLNPQG